MKSLFAREKFPRVIHLAAQAGVRYSLENPQAYIDSNVTGTLNVLEGCRHNGAEHLVFASTSSVYGLNTNMPFSRAPRRRSSAVAVRVDQARQRAHGAQLRGAVQTTRDRPALLHRVRSLGPARTWRCSCSRRTSSRASPSTCSTTATTSATSRSSNDIAEGVVRACDRVATPNAEWSGDDPDPATQQRAVPHLQHRQQCARRPESLHRSARGLPGQEGGQEHAAAAGRRRAGHLRRRRRPGARRGLQAGDAGGSRHPAASSTGTWSTTRTRRRRPRA